MVNNYNLKIQQLYHAFNNISREYQKTPHQIWYDILEYHSRVKNGFVQTTQTNILFFTEIEKRAKEFSQESDKNAFKTN